MVAHLSAGFGVERGLIEHEFGLCAGGDALHGFLVDEQADHARRGFEFAVAEEFGAAEFEQRLIGRHHDALLRALPTGAGALALVVHLGVESGAVDGEAMLASHVFLLVEREAVGVVELEGKRAGDGLPRRGS